MNFSLSRSLRRMLSITMLVAAMALVFAGCGSSAPENKDGGKPTVAVTTSFLADIVDQIAGDYVNVDMIIPAGDDPHLYVAKPQDLQTLQNADLVLYHGLHFEGKMQEPLEKKGVAVTKTFKKSDIGSMTEDGNVIVDPHFWFNVALYKEAVQNASLELVKLVPDHKEQIEKNTTAYLKELDDVKAYATEQLALIPSDHKYLITPHDAFNYFSREYDIPVMAPQGVSTDSEVSNQAIEETANFIVDHKIKAIFAESTTDPARMEKLREVCKSKGWDVKVVSGDDQELFSDSLAPKGEHGDTYVSMYKHNIDLITQNLK